MIVRRTSKLTGVVHEMVLPITIRQYAEWKNGKVVQDAFPQLNADQREFLMTGITPEEWDAHMKDPS